MRLDSLVKFEEGVGPAVITRRNRQYAGFIYASLEGLPLGDATSAVKNIASEILPAGYHIAFTGQAEEFADIELHLPPQTPFQKSVHARTRKILYGRALTYGELAQKSGYPRAARAVGSVMSSNRFPIVVPCHRVVPSGGKIGQYTNPRGSELKEKLLAMEARGDRV